MHSPISPKMQEASMIDPLQSKCGQRGLSEDLGPGGEAPEIRGLIEILSAHAATNRAASDALETRNFNLEEATIGDIHRAIRERRLTCRALALTYLQRIHAYSVHGPHLNAFVNINLKILDEAQALDEEFQVTWAHRVIPSSYSN